MPFALDPQVAGELGENTVIDTSSHPPVVSHVDFVLDYPETDDLIQAFPVLLVSAEMADRLTAADVAGVALSGASVRPSEDCLAVYGAAGTGSYRRLEPVGTERDDCWLSNEFLICVSDRMMRILAQGIMKNCDTKEIPS